MGFHLDRERERSDRRKALRNFSDDIRRRYGRDATPAEMESAKRAWGAPGAGVQLPVPSGTRQSALPSVSTRKAPLFVVPEDVDLRGPRGQYHQVELKFHEAIEKGDRDSALECVPLMISALMAAAGFNNPIVEAPGMMKVLCEITDLMNDRNSQLFQRLALKPGRKRTSKPAAEWMAIVGLLIAAAIVERTHGFGREKALVKVFEDLEATYIKGEANHYLTESGHEAAASPQQRRAALAKRLARHHRDDLICQDPGPREIANLYRKGLAAIKAENVDALKAPRTVDGGTFYDMWLATAANLLRDGRPHSDWRIDPKNGKLAK